MEKINKLCHTRDILEQQVITSNSCEVLSNNFRRQKISVLAINSDGIGKLKLPN